MPRLTRRELLHLGAQGATLALLPRSLRPVPRLVDLGGAQPVPVPPITDPDVKTLALRAVEASRAAGASYADVRLTHTYFSYAGPGSLEFLNNDAILKSQAPMAIDERMHVGVRALVDGYWGFASSGLWTPDEMARLARAAVAQAKTNALGKPRPVELAAVPVVADGHWVMPVKWDPFQVEPMEMYNLLKSIEWYAYRWRGRNQGTPLGVDANFQWQAKAFASTAGSYCTQQLHRSWGSFAVKMRRGSEEVAGCLDFLSPAGVGFELFRDQDLQAAVWQLLDELDADVEIPDGPIEVGRYDTVMDARAVAALLDQTLGRATELDRTLGYEANATGTSYINDPFGMVGSYQAAAPAVTVTANRSEPGGCATVQWDDEGVTPEPEGFPVVKDGVLTDFHTMRESASWLKDYYGKQARPVRSHGCAAAPTALHAPLTHTPNLALAPGATAQDFDALVGTLKNGIALKCWGSDVDFDMDFQCLNGLAHNGTFYRVKDGRLMARLPNAGVLFRSPELWKGVLALGGAASRRRYGLSATKGEPLQATSHSVTAPPTVFKQLTLIDVKRKA